MRVCDAVVVDRNPIRPDALHRHFVRTWIVDGLLRIRVGGHRHGYSFFHERGCLTSLGRRDQIERADLIVFSPSAPVGELGFPALVLLRAHRVLLGILRTCQPDRPGDHYCHSEDVHETVRFHTGSSILVRVRCSMYPRAAMGQMSTTAWPSTT